jgi:chemotaxis protein methyltransferase CheR
MIDAICTNETSFFREPRQFDYLRNQWIPMLRAEAAAGRRSRRVRIWSAGCSTGEEPYSLAMLCSELLTPAEGWDVQILATDLSTRVLERACEGAWPISRANDIPYPYLRRFMLRGIRNEAGTMKAGAEIRKLISFGRLNLVDETYPLADDFDLILCRNVLIYFDRELRAKIIDRFFRHLLPGALLCLGHAETLNGFDTSARPVIPNVYSK